MKYSNFYRILIIVLLLISGGTFFYLSNLTKPEALYLNLTSEVIGILLTVVIVEWIANYYVSHYWESPVSKINSTLQGITYEIISNIAGGLGFRPNQIFNVQLVASTNQRESQEEIIRGIDEELIPLNIEECLNNFEEERWTNLENRLEQNYKKLDHFISLFGQKLSPEIFDFILDIREAHASALRLPIYANRDDVEINNDQMIAIICTRLFSISDNSRKLLERLKEKVL